MEKELEALKNSEQLGNQIMDILANKQASNILMIDVSAKSSITNYYVVCTARNVSQAKVFCEEIQSVLESQGRVVARIDGEKEGKWIVMDYGLVIVHIFHTEMREYYKFEKLWIEPDSSNVVYKMSI